MIAIAMEMVRSEYLLVEVDDAEQRGKYILYQHAEFFYYAINIMSSIQLQIQLFIYQHRR